MLLVFQVRLKNYAYLYIVASLTELKKKAVIFTVFLFVYVSNPLAYNSLTGTLPIEV